MPEPGQQNRARWHVTGWSLRTKVAVVLALPALVALVLGGLRVQEQLDEASRLTTLRDQMSMLRDTVSLAHQLSNEMVAAVSSDPALKNLQAAVDERLARVQAQADATGLPSEQRAILSKAAGQLSELRRAVAGSERNPTNETAGYLDIVNGLSDLGPGLVTVADDDLEAPARAVSGVLRLRGILAIEEILLRFGSGNVPVDAGTGQRAAAEESLLSEQIKRDIPPGELAAFTEATASATPRRDAFQAAFAGLAPISPQALLPGLRTEAESLDKLGSNLVGNLAGIVSERTTQARSDALRDAAIVLGALLAALAVALVVARALLSPVRLLRTAALDVAHTRLPDTVERVRDGERVDWRSVEPVPVHASDEIGQLARAFDDMHQQAVRLAGEQAELRRQVSEMFTTLSRRSQSLVELQLEVIDSLESDEQDPDRLEGLFRLDHLATRLRRNGENLQVLAGGTPARRGQGPVTVVELLRAATSEVNDYRRITLGHAPNGSVRANAAADIVHILAELLENATRYSSPDRKVVLTADRGSDGGLLIEVVDAGLGMTPDDLASANQRLAAADVVGPETTRRMGLFVVSRLAERHGVTVRLRPTYDLAKQAGITASVHVPPTLVLAEGTPEEPVVVTAQQPEPVTATITALPQPSIQAPVPPALTSPTLTPLSLTPPVPVPSAPPHRPGQNWFLPLGEAPISGDGGTAEPVSVRPVAPSSTWLNPADTMWQAADSAMSQQPVRTTAAGLPLRKPGARVTPAATSEREPATSRLAAFRDPDSIRSNLARHYDGVRAARHRTHPEPESREGS